MADEINLQVKLVPDTKDLERVLKKYQGQQVQVNATMPGASGSGAKGAMAGLGPAVAAITTVVAAVYTVKKVLDRIHESMEKLNVKMGEINPTFKRQEDLMKKMYNMALLPISQLMNMMMKPYLQMMILKMKEMRKETQPLLDEYKNATPERKSEIQDEILALYKDYAGDLAAINYVFNLETARIRGTVAGFQEALDTILGDWLLGTKEYIEGVKSGLEVLDVMPEKFAEVATDLKNAISAGAIEMTTLTPLLDALVTDTETTVSKISDRFVLLQTALDAALDFFTIGFGGALGNLITNMQEWADEVKRREADVKKQEDRGFFGRLWDKGKEMLGSGDDDDGIMERDFISRPGQATQSFSPSDTIVGMKDISMLGGQGTGDVTINVYGTSEEVVGKIKKELINALDRYGRF